MTERIMTAQDFVFIYLIYADQLGREAALLHPRVQAARRQYLAACK